MNNNLDAIEQINQKLSDWIRKDFDDSWIKIIKSENGKKNFLVGQGDNLVLAYDIKDPVREAEEAAKNMRLIKENISIVIGIGLGYFTNSLLENKEEGHRVVVIEVSRTMMNLALNEFDFSDFIKKGELVLINNIEDVDLLLNAVSSQVEDWIFTVDRYVNFKPDKYAGIADKTKKIINQIMCNVGTIAGEAGGKIADNDCACLPYLIRHRGVIELKDLYKDKPAILVSTGPSLQKNIHNLIGNTDKFVLIAVGQALRVLLAYGIKPDFVCTVDFCEVNMGHFEGLMDSNVPLVTINRAYAPLLKAWRGPKFVVSTPVFGFEDTVAGILTNKGFIEAGGSVSHLSFGLAKWLGCNPITLIGQDLAYEKDLSHIEQADAGGKIKVDSSGIIKWDIKDQRCSLHKKDINMGYARYVPGYFGGNVLTNSGLLSFLTTFENMFERHLKETG
jgi:hypothetical protein